MAYNFLGCDRDQPFLLPPDLRDWLPEGHLAWFILDVVDQLDLEPFYRQHRDDGHGHPAYDPKALLGVLPYAYAVGVRSSRQIERRLTDIGIPASACEGRRATGDQLTPPFEQQAGGRQGRECSERSMGGRSQRDRMVGSMVCSATASTSAERCPGRAGRAGGR
jgi:hypothetical protein